MEEDDDGGVEEGWADRIVVAIKQYQIFVASVSVVQQGAVPLVDEAIFKGVACSRRPPSPTSRGARHVVERAAGRP